jgi:hypothetical protein
MFLFQLHAQQSVQSVNVFRHSSCLEAWVKAPLDSKGRKDVQSHLLTRGHTYHEQTPILDSCSLLQNQRRLFVATDLMWPVHSDVSPHPVQGKYHTAF